MTRTQLFFIIIFNLKLKVTNEFDIRNSRENSLFPFYFKEISNTIELFDSNEYYFIELDNDFIDYDSVTKSVKKFERLVDDSTSPTEENYKEIESNSKTNIFRKFLQQLGFLRSSSSSSIVSEKAHPESDGISDDKITKTGLDLNFSFAAGLISMLSFKEQVKTIFPGTLWCGSGDAAKTQYDLGVFFLTDKCCKEHDNCPKFIPSGKLKYGLKNPGLFTRSHCICDQAFYNCLKRADTLLSNKIGYTFFNILSPQCFREEYPIVSCAKKQNKACLSYIIDETKNKTWQWFDNKIY